MNGVEIVGVIPVAARMFGALVGLPIGDGLQLLPRLCIAVLFGAVIAQDRSDNSSYSLLMLPADFLIGYILVVPARCIGEVAAMFGEIIDTARGQTLAAILDPLSGQQVSDLTTVMRLGGIALVVSLGGIEAALVLVKISCEASMSFGSLLQESVLMDTVRSSIALGGAALHLAAIWLLAYLLIDVGCACMAKVAHGLSFSSMSSVLKLLATGFLLLQLLASGDRVTALLGRFVWQPSASVGQPSGRSHDD